MAIKAFELYGEIMLEGADEAKAGLRDVDATGARVGDTLGDKKLGSVLKNIGKAFVAVGVAAAGVVKVGFDLAEAAGDLGEAQNVVTAVFETSGEQMIEWSKTMAATAGMSETTATKFAGSMGAMLKSSGLSEDAAADMSKGLVQLTGDMSSFYNLSHEEMWQKIRSGIAGETEPLKQLGINMSVANLEAYALSQGIDKSFSSMTQAEQAALRYNYIMQATEAAHGDFADTLETSFANQMRTAQMQWESLKTEVGSAVLPVFMEFFKSLNAGMPKVRDLIMGAFDKLAPVLEDILPLISDLMISLIDMAVDILPPLLDVFTVLISEILPVLFDVLSPILDVISALLSAAGDILKAILPPIMELLTVFATEILPPLADMFVGFIETLLPPLVSLLTLIIESIMPPLMNLFDIFVQQVLPPLVDIFGLLIEQLLPPIMALFTEIIEKIMPPLMDIFNIYIEQVLPPLLDIFTTLIDTLLPPLMKLFSSVAENILPPLVEVVGVLFEALEPVFTLIGGLVESLLPPLKPFIEAIAGVLDLLEPILRPIGDIIKIIIEPIKWLVGVFGDALDWIMGLFKADGGPIKTSGTYVVGEQGPEAVSLPAGAYVQTASRTAEAGIGGNRGQNTINIYTNGELSPYDTYRVWKKQMAVAGR